MFVNSSPIILSILKVSSSGNKGQLLSDTMASHDLDICILLSYDFVFLQKPRSSRLGGVFGFFIRCSYIYIYIDAFDNMVV